MNAEFESRCEFCKEEVVSLDDYSNHLIIVHNLKASLISNIVERALKPANNQPEIEEIVIDDDDDEDDAFDAEEPQVDEELFEIDTFVSGLFKDLNLLVDGILPEKFNEDIVHQTKNDDFQLPQDLADCFTDLRDFVEKMGDEESKSLNLEGSQVGKILYNIKTEDNASPKPKTIFLCPKDNCGFFTTKKGFRDLTAANHFTKVHKLTLADFSSGKFTFKKHKVTQDDISSGRFTI